MSVLFHLVFLIDHNKSLVSTSRTFAISTNVSKFGCMVFVHHFETVPGSFPNCSANHLLVRFFLRAPPLADLYLYSYNLLL